MERIVPAVRKTLTAEEISSNSLFKTMSSRHIRAEAVEEGIFPDEILETIERRRKQLLGKIEEFVVKSSAGYLKNERAPEIEEVKSTIRIILLEIEKLQAQTGTACVRECDRMLYELEEIQKRIKDVRKRHKTYILVGVTVIACILAGICKEALVRYLSNSG